MAADTKTDKALTWGDALGALSQILLNQKRLTTPTPVNPDFRGVNAQIPTPFSPAVQQQPVPMAQQQPSLGALLQGRM